MMIAVRVSPKTGAKAFRRCGMRFTDEWAEFDVDEATAKRLLAEQMLDVAEVLDGDGLDEADLSGLPEQTFEEAVAQADEAPAPNEAPVAGSEAAKAPAKAKKAAAKKG